MSKIRNRDTIPEVTVRKYLFSRGLRFRKNDYRYPGRPDIVLPRYKTVVFINGCFWHYHFGCKQSTIPKANKSFWEDKLLGNVKRDNDNYSKLKHNGWNVIVVWECELKKKVQIERLEKLYMEITNPKKTYADGNENSLLN